MYNNSLNRSWAKYVWILFLIGGWAEVYAQKGVLYEQYVQSPMVINPAFTGVREDFNITGTFRRKWLRQQNQPSSQSMVMDGAFGLDKQFGAGFQALNDQTSGFSTTGIYGTFAYHFALNREWKLGLGMQGGINFLPVFDHSLISTSNRAFGSLGLGVLLRSENFYVGLSKPEMLSPSFGNQPIVTYYRKPLNLMLGGSYELGPELLLLPQLVLTQEKDYHLRYDLGTRLWVDEKVGVGVSYRGGGASKFGLEAVNYFQFTGEVSIGKNVRIGYFYNTKQVEILLPYGGPQGVHEIMLKFTPNPSSFHKY
jgi:type IX secretion system PorP/SprF family membrane protein